MVLRAQNCGTSGCGAVDDGYQKKDGRRKQFDSVHRIVAIEVCSLCSPEMGFDDSVRLLILAGASNERFPPQDSGLYIAKVQGLSHASEEVALDWVESSRTGKQKQALEHLRSDEEIIAAKVNVTLTISFVLRFVELFDQVLRSSGSH